MKPLLLSLSFLCLPFAMQAQTVITTAGDHVENDGISVTWTLGEVVTETLSHDNLILSQGQQQFTVRLISAIGEKHELALAVYPNPTNNALSVAFSGDGKSSLMLTLHNSLGSEIRQQKLTSNQENTISMAEYPAGVYIITIKDQKEILRSFKIIKQ